MGLLISEHEPRLTVKSLKTVHNKGSRQPNQEGTSHVCRPLRFARLLQHASRESCRRGLSLLFSVTTENVIFKVGHGQPTEHDGDADISVVAGRQQRRGRVHNINERKSCAAINVDECKAQRKAKSRGKRRDREFCSHARAHRWCEMDTSKELGALCSWRAWRNERCHRDCALRCRQDPSSKRSFLRLFQSYYFTAKDWSPEYNKKTVIPLC